MTFEEAAGGEHPAAGGIPAGAAAGGSPPPAPPEEGRRSLLPEWLRRPAPDRSLDSYRDSPANPAPGKEYGARIARGLDGLLGGAGLAIWDLGIGLVGLLRDRSRPAAPQPPPKEAPADVAR